MKLISLLILTVHITRLEAQKYEDEQFFLPHYQPGSSAFASDSSHYLPPETHTAIPYFSMKNTNKLPFQYLPPTGTKAPSSFPTPFPVIMSSTLIPIFDDDDEPKKNNDHPISSPQPPSSVPQLKRFNNTQRSQHNKEPEKREMRPIPKTINYDHPMDRIDIKPGYFPMNAGPTQNSQANQASASRRTIPILTVDSLGLRNDASEMMKAGSFPTHQYMHAPAVFISSSTTEPAIPIIRLSNEMDLDGSFSYEALGADQTHYVQHSRMENMGSDKEEQVVEGSYSYVGDNGQTYTVHYIADSNGFRATGDHLPVAPPMPEIIQRAVQYNLAEEAKRPAHLKSWQEDEKAYDLEAEKIHRFPSSPPRNNLFTGRTPEAFSYSFSPGISQNSQNNQNNQNNQNMQNNQNSQNLANLATAASSVQSVKSSADFTKDQTQAKLNNGPISPQITFLASQGAHVPSMNTPQQSISRIFTTEKSNMPQLMNYEAVIKDSDQESNKALWRWQYGLNPNNGNQNTNKNTISRSSGDEIMINFSEMTPEQYTSMLQAQLEPNIRNNVQQMQYVEDKQATIYNNYNDDHTHNKQNTTETKIENEYQPVVTNNDGAQNKFINQNTAIQNTHLYQNQKAFAYNQPIINQNQNNQVYSNDVSPAPQASIPSSALPFSESQNDWYQTITKSTPPSKEQIKQIDEPVQNFQQSKIITHHDFVPPSQTVTKSYDYEESFYESRKIYDGTKDVKDDFANSSPLPSYFNVSSIQSFDNDIRISTTEQPSITSNEPTIQFVDFINTDDSKLQTPSSSEANIRFVDFIKSEDSKFQPVTNKNIEEYREPTTTTTQASVEDILENNIFLKNLVRTKKKENNSYNNIEESKMKYQSNVNAEPKVEKNPKFIQYQTQVMNDIKAYRKKTVDLSDVVNYVAQKNHFESNKVKPKHKPINFSNLNQGGKMIYIPTHTEDNNEESEKAESNNFRNLNHQQQEELRGIIKNYKILQRNNNNIRNEEDRMNQLRRDLSPPPLKMLHSPNLPPLGRAGPSMKSYLPPIFV